jgi:hypothetical protein
MKKIILLNIVLLFCRHIASAQSKKEIIQTLNMRVDSFKIELFNNEMLYREHLTLLAKKNDSVAVQLSDLKIRISSLKDEISLAKKENMEQKLIISNLKDELKYAADSILKLNRLIAEFGNIAESKDISAALIKANEKWSYFFGDFANSKFLILDSLHMVCNEQRCVSYLLTNKFLLISYKIIDVTEFDTQIIDLKTNQDLLSNTKIKIHVEDYNKKQGVLKISTEGYDKSGHYWQDGVWLINDRSLQLGNKTY